MDDSILSTNINVLCVFLHLQSFINNNNMNWNTVKYNQFRLSVIVLIIHSFYNPTDSGAVQITQSNLDILLASNEVVFINFYADWCNKLMHIFDDAADEVTKAGYVTGKVILGKVDCDKEAAIATRFHITKYPTLKLFRNGLPAKKEYRGQISVTAFADFLKKQLVDPILTFGSLKELQGLSEDKRHIIGYMDRRDQQEYEILRRVATSLKDECLFHVGFSDASQTMHPPGQPIVVFRTDRQTSVEPDEPYKGLLSNFDELYNWVQKKCIILVREVTFENAEEFTKEGLPFLILFHHPMDTENVKKYKELIARDLESEKQNINFLTADGVKFEHALQVLGKSISDLPIIAIDSFNHMYLFPDYKDMDKPGKLKQFLQDLYSGKLHREFHYNLEMHQVETKSDVKVTTPTGTTAKPQVKAKSDVKVTTPPEFTYRKPFCLPY